MGAGADGVAARVAVAKAVVMAGAVTEVVRAVALAEERAAARAGWVDSGEVAR